jgi:hypothetical protein
MTNKESNLEITVADKNNHKHKLFQSLDGKMELPYLVCTLMFYFIFHQLGHDILSEN